MFHVIKSQPCTKFSTTSNLYLRTFYMLWRFVWFHNHIGGGVCETCGTHICVTAWQIFSVQSSVELSRHLIVHCHGHLSNTCIGLPLDQKHVKFGTNWLQMLRNADLWNCWMDLAHFKFYGLIHRPHSRQVTGARCTGGRGLPVMSWILLKANNAQQASGAGD